MSASSHVIRQTARRRREARLREKDELHQIALRRDNPDYAMPDFVQAEAGIFVDGEGGLEPPPEGRKRKLVLGLVLLPVCIVAVLTLVELFFRATVDGMFWKTEGFWFFTFGCLLWFALGWMKMQPAWLYVFAHEFTHALSARLSGGRVHSMHVTEEGGYIETDKANWFITLSPYLVPLYTVVVLALYSAVTWAVDMHRDVVFTVPGLGLSVWLRWVWVVYFLVGLTWCFHLTFTLEVLGQEQSDLRHNGEFFSIILIFGVNLALIGTMFIIASPTLGWADVWEGARGTVLHAWDWLRGKWQMLRA